MKVFFGRWWLPVLIHGLVLAYFFVSEKYSEPKSANDLNLGGGVIILISCVLLAISVIYQLAVRNFLAGLITAVLLAVTISVLFI